MPCIMLMLYYNCFNNWIVNFYGDVFDYKYACRRCIPLRFFYDKVSMKPSSGIRRQTNPTAFYALFTIPYLLPLLLS
jgi:hypothetical protein